METNLLSLLSSYVLKCLDLAQYLFDLFVVDAIHFVFLLSDFSSYLFKTFYLLDQAAYLWMEGLVLSQDNNIFFYLFSVAYFTRGLEHLDKMSHGLVIESFDRI